MATRILNKSGGESHYTLVLATDQNAQYGHLYAVHDERRQRVWLVAGYNGDLVDGASAPHVAGTRPWTEQVRTDPTPPPKYVIRAVKREWARDQLRAALPKGSTVYTILHHVSASGMSRKIGLRAIVNNEPQYLDGLARIAMDWQLDPHGQGIMVGGYGMDMGFHLAYALSWALWDDGYALNHRWI